MSAIITRERVCAAVDRALQLDPAGDIDAAMSTTAQALGLPLEAVHEAMEPSAQELQALAS